MTQQDCKHEAYGFNLNNAYFQVNVIANGLHQRNNKTYMTMSNTTY